MVERFRIVYEGIVADVEKSKDFTSNAVKQDKRVFGLYNSNIKTLKTYYRYLNDLKEEPEGDHHHKVQILKDLKLYSEDRDDENINARASIILKMYHAGIVDKQYLLMLMLFFLAIDSNYPIVKGAETIMDVLPLDYFVKYDEYLEVLINKKTTIVNPVFGAYVFYSNKELLYAYMDMIDKISEEERKWLEKVEEDKKSLIYKRIHDCQPGSFKNEAILASYYYVLNDMDLDGTKGYDVIVNKIIDTYKQKIFYLAHEDAPSEDDWEKFKSILLSLTEKEKSVFLKAIGNTSANVEFFSKNTKRRSASKRTRQNVQGWDLIGSSKRRVNQGVFRKRLIEDERHVGCRVCQCKVKEEEYLRASHIVAWSESNSSEKVDRDNGFLLCPIHDFLFDSHLISFDDDGKMLIGKGVRLEYYETFNISPNHTIEIDEGNKKYLAKHREIFGEQDK